MTNEELLARIKRYGDWAEVAFDTSVTNALRVVVELAGKNVEQESFDPLDGYEIAMKAVIQAIEKELA